MTTTTTTKAIVSSNLISVAIKGCLPEEATVEQCVAHYTITTYAVDGDVRAMAKAVAKYIVQGAAPETLELHANTKKLVRAAGLKYNIKFGVGYPNTDGTLHYFVCRMPSTWAASTPTAPKWVDIKARHMAPKERYVNPIVEEIEKRIQFRRTGK